MNPSRRVAVVTGSRAEFGLLEPIMEAIREHDDLGLAVVVTGMHLEERFGNTVEEVDRRFEVSARIPMPHPGRTGGDMARGLARGIAGMVEAFEELEPSIVLVLGDRAEPLAAGLAAAHQRIALAHVHGGDVSRCGIDDPVRHALTQFAHVHFPATATSARRIRQMGQSASRIHVVGAPGLDRLSRGPLPTREEVADRVGISTEEPYLALLHHPDTTNSQGAAHEIDTILEAIERIALPCVAIHPNSDAGHQSIVDRLEAATRSGRIVRFESLERDLFLGLLAGAVAFVGNSSAGIIEGPALGVPFVEVGTRQSGRERGSNVLSVPCEPDAIAAALSRAHDDSAWRAGLIDAPHPYGDGTCGPRIAQVLSSLQIDETLLQKELDFP